MISSGLCSWVLAPQKNRDAGALHDVSEKDMVHCASSTSLISRFSFAYREHDGMHLCTNDSQHVVPKPSRHWP